MKKKERQNNHVEILKNTPHLYHTMCFQYTSHRIAKIGSKLIKIIKKFIPNFQLDIISRKVHLEPIILPKLKMKKNNNEEEVVLPNFWALIPNQSYPYTRIANISWN